MAFKNLFRPKWKHRDPFVRMEAVKKLKDQKILAEIAKNDKENLIKQAAIDKIQDQSLLSEIARNGKEKSVKEAVIGKVKDQNLLEREGDQCEKLGSNKKNGNVERRKGFDQNLLMDRCSLCGQKKDESFRLYKMFSVLKYKQIGPFTTSDPNSILSSDKVETHYWFKDVMPHSFLVCKSCRKKPIKNNLLFYLFFSPVIFLWLMLIFKSNPKYILIMIILAGISHLALLYTFRKELRAELGERNVSFGTFTFLVSVILYPIFWFINDGFIKVFSLFIISGLIYLIRGFDNHNFSLKAFLEKKTLEQREEKTGKLESTFEGPSYWALTEDSVWLKDIHKSGL